MSNHSLHRWSNVNLITDILLTHQHTQGPKQPEPEKNRNRGQADKSDAVWKVSRTFAALFSSSQRKHLAYICAASLWIAGRSCYTKKKKKKNSLEIHLDYVMTTPRSSGPGWQFPRIGGISLSACFSLTANTEKIFTAFFSREGSNALQGRSTGN